MPNISQEDRKTEHEEICPSRKSDIPQEQVA
jgi:hypothetical protein